MQTLANSVHCLAWDQIDLLNGVYSVRNCRWLRKAPNLTKWTDCSASDQVQDEIAIVLGLLGEEYTGMWVGMAYLPGKVCHGVAWRVDEVPIRAKERPDQ